jgi:hypothetical protein
MSEISYKERHDYFYVKRKSRTAEQDVMFLSNTFPQPLLLLKCDDSCCIGAQVISTACNLPIEVVRRVRWTACVATKSL